MAIPTRRMIFTKLWEDPAFMKLVPTERLLYIGMIVFGDDEGRLRGDGRFLKKYFFYGDRIGAGKLEKMRDKIADFGLIIVYKVDDSTFIQHPKWSELQTLKKERSKISDYPPPPASTWTPHGTQEDAEDKKSKDKKSEVNESKEKAEITDFTNFKSRRERVLEAMEKAKNKSN